LPSPGAMLRARTAPLIRGAVALHAHALHSLAAHQARAMKQAGRLPSKFKYTRNGGKPRVDKSFVEPERAWIVVDAYGEVMGRLASRIVPLLTGKHKPTFQNHHDVGDNVIIVNAAYVVATGKAMEKKKYYHHTLYPGGLKTTPLWRLFEQNPIEPLRRAIFGMLPHNKLRYQRMARLRMFPTAEHAQEASLRAANGLAFRAILPPDDAPVRLERIQPASEARDTP